MEKILDIQDVVLRFYTYEGVVKALEGVSLYVNKGETLGIVGETGCGKTMTGLSILFLIPSPGKIESGKILFEDEDGTVDILSQDDSTLRHIRGKEISMIFQEPSAALNPLFTVEEQISEVLIHHKREVLIKRALEGIEEDIQRADKSSIKAPIFNLQKKIYQKMSSNPDSLSLKFLSRIPLIKMYQRRLKPEMKREVINLLREMRIPDPERVAEMYPHELSGGMRQRVVIAMALACNPDILISDEPTTNLDVTIEAQILHLIKELKKEFGSSIIYITHDMGVVAELCDRVAVMYAGTICEVADVVETFKNPLHPYTKALLESIPRPDKEFKSIVGTVPSLINPPAGCRFNPRCPNAMKVCSEVKPVLTKVEKEHFVACHLYTGSLDEDNIGN